jgi:type VI secretion system protein ImpC
VRAHAAPKQADDPARDAALGERMRGVLHHPQFQAVESAWRGLDFLVRRADLDGPEAGANGGARIFIAHYSRDDANRDLLAATSLRETRLVELLNARKWRAIAGLYKFGPDASDIELLARMALLAAHLRAPFVSAYSVAEGAVDMGPYWSELTAIPEAGHLGLVLPRFLLRLPYGARTTPIDSFAFEEMPDVPLHGHYLWGNPALACLTLLARGGGSLDLTGLPLHTYQKDGEWTMTPCAEVLMTEVQELALIEMGLMPLVSSSKSDCARLAGFRAINGDELPL